MTILLERINSVPMGNEVFEPDFDSWLHVLIDTLNEDLEDIEDGLNGFDNGIVVPSFTAVQIAALTGVPDGIILYDTTNNVYVGKISGTLVKFSTLAYP